MSKASTTEGEQANFDSTEIEVNDVMSPNPEATVNSSFAGREQSTSSSAVSSAAWGGWWLVDVLLRRWRWLAAGGGALAVMGLLAGLMLWKKQYSVSAQLIRYESPNSQEVFGFRQATPQTLAGVLRAPELMRRVARQARPPLTADQLAENLRVTPDRNSELLTVTLFGGDARTLVELVNLYAREAVRFTGESQVKMAVEVRDYQQQQLVQIENEIAKLNDQLLAMPRSVLKAVPSRPAPLLEKLQMERDELVVLLARYTEVHPLVKEQRAKVAAIEKQLAELRASAAFAAPDNSKRGGGNDPQPKVAANALLAADSMTDIEIIRSKLQSLENGRLQLLGRERAAQLLAENPPGLFRIFSEAVPGGVITHNTGIKTVFLAIFSGLIGVSLVAAWIAWQELVEDRLVGPYDVQRVTRLPLLASLGDLKSMSGDDRERWAFRTWTALQSRLSLSPNHGLVCGVTSVEHGAGRSTWIKLLAEAASQCGFRVLTIATQPSPQQTEGLQTNDDGNQENFESRLVSFSSNVLASPAEVTEKLVGPNSQPLVHIPLPGWVWNLDRRKEWKTALADWGRIENIVILVELPPASVPEAVLLGENLPNMIWLADAGKTSATKTRRELETLRYARCHLVGAVLNHKSASPLKNIFPRWLAGLDGMPA